MGHEQTMTTTMNHKQNNNKHINNKQTNIAINYIKTTANEQTINKPATPQIKSKTQQQTHTHTQTKQQQQQQQTHRIF